ncbi:MAG: hypothetical protein M1834_006399 [Cirrosporium novae-zelandiae]|nr:MAG: hypothetical protein M1834_006399 [Cirrosporium novae-zelandiae]
MASVQDTKIASLAAGWTLGFGFLTIWEAIKQTQRNKSPLRSAYIFMIWGEIIVNVAIGIIAWLFLDGIIANSVAVLFFILFLWVFEVQFLLQIVINRIAIIAEDQKKTRRIKWGTAIIITAVNIAVFCIWIPAHLTPPVNATYWDRTSKVIICLVDGGLNWYFLHTVNHRLVHQHGLLKYKPLVIFNGRLMVVSISMDLMLIGLMSLPNQVVYIQFHPVAYMVKLNIEMSMASLIVRLARGTNNDADRPGYSSYSHNQSGGAPYTGNYSQSHKMQSFVPAEHSASRNHQDRANHSESGIERRTDVHVLVEEASSLDESNESGKGNSLQYSEGDEAPLKQDHGMPIQSPSISKFSGAKKDFVKLH